MIYRQNLELLKNIHPGQLLSVDSNKTIKINNGFGAKWISPSKNILDAIFVSFNHYVKLFNVINSEPYEKINQETDTTYPNLYLALEGLLTLKETYNKINVDHTYLTEIINIHTNIETELKKLNNEHPEFFQNRIEKDTTIGECEETLKSIETKLETIVSQSAHPDREKAQILMAYVNVLRQTIQNCYKTLNQKTVNLLKIVIEFFNKLTKNKQTATAPQNEPAEKLAEKLGYDNIETN
jgi:hypothetical protein